MFILHIALQGCLRARDVPYGLTPDTGGHIKYLLELVAACDAQPSVTRQQIVVRRFQDENLGAIYGQDVERVSSKTDIVRLAGETSGYVAKEEMFRELDALANTLEAHIAALDCRPDLIHAHYADAGWLAAQMKQRLGIPYIFTAHSLGRVKERAVTGCSVSKRIAIEDLAIAAADRIIASSIDEAEHQYSLYPKAAPERIRVNPPGCDLADFMEVPDVPARVARDIEKFITRPDKPCILALARPVRKKNLEGLLLAYAGNERLQEVANLIIFAGTRDDLRKIEGECRDVLETLLALIDIHDLWGKVALPKTHEPGDVPAIYDYARQRGGVFANVAFNEPFGLTFLEAAAAGLPVVATCRGGPNDIVGRLENGVLVDPTKPADISAALLDVLSDRAAWQRMSENGQANVSFYAWDRHAQDYIADVRAITILTVHPARSADRYKRLLVCDIDNTLTGCRTGLAELTDWIDRSPDTAFAIATGRSLNSAQDIIAAWGIPDPCVWITSVGSEIYWPVDASGRLLSADEDWKAVAACAWNRDGAGAALADLDWLQPQANREQRAYKLSYVLDDPTRVPDVRAALDAAGVAVELIYSHGRFLDVLPAHVSKGHAIRHVARQLGVAISDVFGAGDSGNDLQMLTMVGHPIVVANHTDELLSLRAQKNAYFTAAPYAAGVLEGVRRVTDGDIAA